MRPERPVGSVTVPTPPPPTSQEVLQVTTSGVGVSKLPRKKQKQEYWRTLAGKWEKSEYMNALECLLRADKKGIEQEFGKIVHVLWIEKGLWEIDEKNLIN